MGQAKRKKEEERRLLELEKRVDLAPLTNPEVKAVVLIYMFRKGLVK